MTIQAILLAVLHIALLAWVRRRREFFHPATLWLVVFSTTTTLYALNLLPYRAMLVESALILCAGTLAFVGGAMLGDRLLARRAPTPDNEGREAAEDAADHGRAASAAVVERAATLGLVGLWAWTLLFIVQVAAAFPLQEVFITSYEVRQAISKQNLASIGVKYTYATLAAAALCAIALAGATTPKARWIWTAGVFSTAVSAYLSTGRSNIILPLLVAGVAYAVASGLQLTLKRQLTVAGVGAVIVLVVFTVGGSIIGKTFENNGLSKVSSVLTDHTLLQPLALPYQYATGPIAAFDVQVRTLPVTPSTDGCATFAVICQVGSAAGFQMAAMPNIRPFTAPPMTWNTYTAMDRPLLDAGAAGVIGLLFLTGTTAGVLFGLANRGGLFATAAYAIAASAVLYAPVQNNFLAPHIVGGVLLSGLAIIVARFWPERLVRLLPVPN
ncbi:MAG: oligosaccharide repeat unit polymerase [Solirubrobacteraceae bacterium]|nr:oligosaccharide repeat unit polymerase [Solirubrobacteraceae bacterium]